MGDFQTKKVFFDYETDPHNFKVRHEEKEIEIPTAYIKEMIQDLNRIRKEHYARNYKPRFTIPQIFKGMFSEDRDTRQLYVNLYKQEYPYLYRLTFSNKCGLNTYSIGRNNVPQEYIKEILTILHKHFNTRYLGYHYLIYSIENGVILRR